MQSRLSPLGSWLSSVMRSRPVSAPAQLNLGTRIMQQAYAIYLIGDDGHFKQRVDVVCNDDEEAKSQAEQMLDGWPVEVWQEARRVVTLLPAK